MAQPQRADPFRNFNFLVEIEGIGQSAFSEVILPEARADIIEYREGAEKTAVRKLPGRIHYGTLVLKWGITTSHELYDWWKTVQDGQVARKSLSVVLLDESRNPVKRWNFRNAWPVRYQLAALNALGHDATIETLEITVESMELA